MSLLWFESFGRQGPRKEVQLLNHYSKGGEGKGERGKGGGGRGQKIKLKSEVPVFTGMRRQATESSDIK